MPDLLCGTLRLRIYLIAGVYLVIVGVLAVQGMSGAQRSAYLLERAGRSYEQLQALYRVNSEIHHHFNRQLEALTLGEATPALAESRQRLHAGFGQLEQMIHAEVDFVTDADEKRAESAELAHLARMAEAVNQLLDQALDADTAGAADEQAAALVFFIRQVLVLFQQRFVPLLDDAVRDEQAEVAAVGSEMQRLRGRLLVIALTGVGSGLSAGLLLIVILSRSLIRPVQRLILATDALAAGRLDTRLPSAGGHELAQLSAHFNRMAAQLDEQHRRLTEINAELEQRVAERTASLRDSNERLRLVDRNRRRFLEDVSHELRSPVTILLGEAEVALRDPAASIGVYRDALLAVQANAGCLGRRIEDLMALARVEDGRLALSLAPLDLGALVERTAGAVLNYARVNAVRLECERAAGPLPVLGEGSWLQQLLMTLLDNAIKFSRPGEVVRVGAAGAGAEVRLWVEDQGVGVSAEQLPRLFERYYQAGNGPRGRGFGLGLAIARWIVEQHGGRIAADGTPAGGVRVEARFPGIPLTPTEENAA